MSDEQLGELLESGRLDELPGEERKRLDQARAGLALAREADVPEPPPGYWDGFAKRLAPRLSRERGRGARRPAWLAAAAAVLVAMASLIPGEAPTDRAQEWTALPALERDLGSLVLAGLGPDLAQLTSGTECAVEECLLVMSDEERGELTRLIAAELSGRES